jgi:hypothetical protein
VLNNRRFDMARFHRPWWGMKHSERAGSEPALFHYYSVLGGLSRQPLELLRQQEAPHAASPIVFAVEKQLEVVKVRLSLAVDSDCNVIFHGNKLSLYPIYHYTTGYSTFQTPQ